jgi:hypothetical protein
MDFSLPWLGGDHVSCAHISLSRTSHMALPKWSECRKCGTACRTYVSLIQTEWTTHSTIGREVFILCNLALATICHEVEFPNSPVSWSCSWCILRLPNWRGGGVSNYMLLGRNLLFPGFTLLYWRSSTGIRVLTISPNICSLFCREVGYLVSRHTNQVEQICGRTGNFPFSSLDSSPSSPLGAEEECGWCWDSVGVDGYEVLIGFLVHSSSISFCK